MIPEEPRRGVETWDPRTVEPSGLIPDPGTYATWSDDAALVPNPPAPAPEAPGVAGQTWEGRQRLWQRFVFAAVSVMVGIGILLIRDMPWVSLSEPRPIAALVLLSVLAYAVVLGGSVAAYFYRRITLNIDAAGVRIRKGFTKRAIAFTDIESVSYVHGRQVSDGRVGAPRHIRIQPSAEYCARTRTRVPGPLSTTWVIPTASFNRAVLLTRILPALKQGVTAAGGQFISTVPDPTRR